MFKIIPYLDTLDDTDSREKLSLQDDSACQPLTSSSRTAELFPLLKRNKFIMFDFETNSSHYENFADIGKGLNGNVVVSVVRHRPSGEFIAAKRALIDVSKKDLDSIQKEVVDTRQLQHPNILPYYCSFVANNEVWTLMPLMTYGSTRDLLDTYFRGGLPEIAIISIMKDVLKGLDYIHNMGIIHRSVKASHILVSDAGRAVLSGLRYSCNMVQNGFLHRTVYNFPEDSFKNLNWLSPEILQQNLRGYNSKSDIYSVGITSCELANGIIPFSEMPSTKMLVEKLKGTTPRLVEDEVLNSDGEFYEKTFSSNFHDFTKKCLTQNQENRPSASMLISHQIFKQMKKSSVTFLDIINNIAPIVNLSDTGKKDTEETDVQCISQQLEDMDLDISWSF